MRIVVTLVGLLAALQGNAEARFSIAKTALEPAELAVVVNVDDPDSEAISVFYQQRRAIPDENIVRVHLGPPSSILAPDQFSKVKAELDARVPAHVQAYALAWTAPYRVGCMSITSAFAFGFDPAYCSAKPCGVTRESPYFNSSSTAPFTDHRMRPAMMLAGRGFQEVKALILRGIKADHTYPPGTGYLLNTGDSSRSVRSVSFSEIVRVFKDALRLERLDADFIKEKSDVLFYFTGQRSVDYLRTLTFVPGAIADHLTSTGGQLTDSGQMSALKWLEVGATGSYGAVVEPCNHLAKFPQPGLVIDRYVAGGSLMEVYWKSVAWPGEGVFIGEPLARPYEPRIVHADSASAEVTWFTATWGNLRLESSISPIGPYGNTEPIPVHPGLNELKISLPDPQRYYRLSP